MGRRTVYGVMPEKNPAEIVGVRPKPLALSLYRDLVTDNIWAYQRHNYGYRNLRSFPLMPHFHGLPYIDIRLSFNSFIPSGLDESWPVVWLTTISNDCLTSPLCTTRLNSRSYSPCYTLDLPDRLKALKEAGFSDNECKIVSESLRRLTNRIVHHEDGL